MKNETGGMKKAEGEAGLTAATLPWWARVLIAQHSGAVFSTIDPHHIHHCSDCGCVLISTNVAYQYFSSICPECGTKKRTPQEGN